MSGPDSAGGTPSSGGEGITIITQTRVRPEAADAFARWQDETSNAIAAFPGFIKQTVMPPSPPQQVDWVILQRFASEETAMAWLKSEVRLKRVQGAVPMILGVDDIHLVHDGGPGPRPAPVSAVISTRIKPGHEAAYRQWEQRIAAAQAKAAGFQGYRFEPPIPGVQDDWVAILRFDTEANLQGWLDSPERQKLLQEAGAFTQEFHARIARTGFDQWFPVEAGDTSPPAAWKQNMIVLLFLYPIVFLFGAWVGTPLLMQRLKMPFWLVLFIGNIVSILSLNYLVPWGSDRLAWWLRPARLSPTKTNLAGAALMVALYIVCLLMFSQFP
jgi:antibiotic biosynthesis monooxygenase (ABM) superfamily enzyme